MKKILLILFVMGVVVGCNKKFVPNKTTSNTTTPSYSNPKNNTTNNNTTTPANELPATVTTRVASVNAMVIIDANGRILTPLEKLPPDENLKPDYTKIARAFTPEQKANLTLRYKMVPPRVIYVPDIFAQKSLRGTYSIYKKKFWYWKKEDGLFYLDESYYK